jgi:hypothetical protein
MHEIVLEGVEISPSRTARRMPLRFLQVPRRRAEAACAEALAEAVHSADVILNILARRRDPVSPITILAPPTLRLQYEPTADCARYDNLRRAS